MAASMCRRNFSIGVVDPTFKGTKGVVYILPEVKTMREVFPAYYDVDGNSQLQAVGGTATGGPAAATPAAYQQKSRSVEGHDLPGVVH